MKLESKKILITGASSGIGAAMAKHFASKKAYLLISGRNMKELERLKDECSQAKGVEVYTFDLENHEEVKKVAEEIIEKHVFIDILINCGGVSQRAYAKDLPFEVDKKIININLLGTIALTKSILPSMLSRNAGVIVTVTSMMGKYGTALRTSYAAAKHGLHGYFDSLRAEVTDKGIQILLVCPGFIKTNVSLNAFGPDGSKAATMDDAIANGIAPVEVAKAVEKAIHNGSEEINVAGSKEMFGLYLKRFTPTLFSKVIRKMKVT